MLQRAHHRDIELTVTGEERLRADDEREVLRVAQEALGNALRHAEAKRIAVDLDLADRPRTLVVRDDGVGFDPAARAVRTRHLGLESMRERARRLGGTLRIVSAPGEGTVVRMEWDGHA